MSSLQDLFLSHVWKHKTCLLNLIPLTLLGVCSPSSSPATPDVSWRQADPTKWDIWDQIYSLNISNSTFISLVITCRHLIRGQKANKTLRSSPEIFHGGSSVGISTLSWTKTSWKMSSSPTKRNRSVKAGICSVFFSELYKRSSSSAAASLVCEHVVSCFSACFISLPQIQLNLE